MKKRIFLTFTVVLLAVIGGCGTKTSNPALENASNDIEMTQTPIETAIPEEEIMKTRSYPDNAYQIMDKDYTNNDWAPFGTVVSFPYETKNHQTEDDTIYQKSALVYLPACYDANDTDTKYNVLYLMHGGSDSPQWFLGKEGGCSQITRMLDSMIEKGEIEPLIICAVSYYTDYCGDATRNCLDFHYELMNDVIPLFETTYHTYAEDVTKEGLAASRQHRAFGGFSMGAVTTWSVLENCIDEFAYFLPISGDCWTLGSTMGGSKPYETAVQLAFKIGEAGKTSSDFYIYSGCGEYDMAEPNLTPQIEGMKKLTDTFIYCDNFADGNLYQCIYPGGGHDVNTVIAILYNGLPKMFDQFYV